MIIFVKHKVREIDSRLEALLFLNKKFILEESNEDIVNFKIKEAAIHYIDTKLKTIPIQIVRIMIGSAIYFSFAILEGEKGKQC